MVRNVHMIKQRVENGAIAIVLKRNIGNYARAFLLPCAEFKKFDYLYVLSTVKYH